MSLMHLFFNTSLFPLPLLLINTGQEMLLWWHCYQRAVYFPSLGVYGTQASPVSAVVQGESQLITLPAILLDLTLPLIFF